MRINEFVKSIESIEDVKDKYFYVCHYERNRNNLFKKVTANLEPTKVKFTTLFDEEALVELQSELRLYSWYNFGRQYFQVYKNGKEVKSKIETYNSNSNTHVAIFDNLEACKKYYYSKLGIHIASIENKLDFTRQDMLNTIKKIENKKY